MSQLRESALAQVRAELQRVVVPELPQHRPRGVHPAPRHEESVEVNKPLECHPAWRDALGYLGRNDLPHALELLGLVIFGTIGMSFRFQGEKVSPSARHRRKKRTRRRTLEGWGGPFCPCSSGSHLQGGAEARGLEVVELPVAQESVRILVADLEDPLQGTHAPRLELARLGVVQRSRRVHHRLLGLHKDLRTVGEPLGRALQADLDLLPLVDQEGELGLQRLRVQHGVLRLGRLHKPVLISPHSVPSSRRRQRRSWVLPL
mmetsp:Transcript_8420/g.25276  ORF Transcript_8420/g.25276 Transcript_8420/m.25276 type:complete len:261 (-) Transcript_8420:154-936(-)